MKQRYLKKIFALYVSLTLTFLLMIGILNGTRTVSKAEPLPTAHFEGMSGIQGMSEKELYEKTNTYKYKGPYTGKASQDSYEYRQYQYYDMSKKVEIPYEIMGGDPQIIMTEAEDRKH